MGRSMTLDPGYVQFVAYLPTGGAVTVTNADRVDTVRVLKTLTGAIPDLDTVLAGTAVAPATATGIPGGEWWPKA